MIGVALTLAGAFPLYARSKYYPPHATTLFRRVPVVLGYLFLLSAIAYYVYMVGWGYGLLVWLLVAMTSFCALMLLTVLPRRYTILFVCLLLAFFIVNIFM